MTESKTPSDSGRRPKAVVILDLLLRGLPVQFPGDTNIYRYQDGILGVEMTRTDTSKPGWSEQVVLGVDVTVPQFISMCEKFTQDEIFIKGAEAVLMSWNSRKERAR